jgi:phosphoenolpyruvate carboxykinase (GTP)
MVRNAHVARWVEEMERLCKPDRVEWLDGSEEEKQRLIAEAVRTGELLELNQTELPGCHYHRSDPNDVARTEKLTYICTPTEAEAGPTNNWMAPAEAYDKARRIFDGSMRGRTMYVVPFLMGPAGSPFSKAGVELTDSLYVALNMRIMTRMGKTALDHLGETSNAFTRGLHSKADLNPDRRMILHFPQDNTIWSVGSGYGGNALLGKKCLALRIASWLGLREGWLAEHMLIVGIESPDGRVTYVTGAFPSACGKTNLAMLVPPSSYKGWKVWTVGDDIAWMRPGEDGRLWAVNPEAGFFGVAPGTNERSNPNALRMVRRDSIFTNVALKPDGTVWWEGMGDPPAQALDWRGRPWTPASPEKAAHPNSRFTTPARNCASISPKWEDPKGVPISAILFGARRADTVPLVFESFDWRHGTYLGATLSSETTAAAEGKVGALRRDPMAMLPFCGYNMGDYWGNWLSVGKRLARPPKVFRVNWFRRDKEGGFLWPGFGDNIRVLRWIIERCEGTGRAEETPIGFMPARGAIDLDGLDLPAGAVDELLGVDHEGWKRALKSQAEFFGKFGDRLPPEIREEHEGLARRLRGTASVPLQH